LQISSLLGLFGCFTSSVMIMHVAFEKLSGESIPGWTAIMTAVLFIGSIQLLATGVLGLYIHSIYSEVKGRPNYIIESLYGFQNEFSVEADNDIREILKKLQKIKLP
jgi:polyisoprenyl-phosphate glycosyltransferase